MKKIVLIITLFISIFSYSQLSSDIKGLGISVGYKKLKNDNLSIGVTGSEYAGFLVGGSWEAKYITDFKKNHLGVLGFNIMFLSVSPGLNISNKYVEPNIGLDFVYVRLNIGYAINYHTRNHVSFGVRFHIPTGIGE